MGNRNAGTTKCLDEGVPDKYTNIGKRWVTTTTSWKSARVTSNTTSLTLFKILLLYLDNDAEEIDDEEEGDNLITSPPLMVDRLKERVLT